MLCEFAITPDAFDAGAITANPRLEVIVIELLKGISEKGKLANLHKGEWAREVYRRIEGLAPGVRDEIITWLTYLQDRRRLVRYPRWSGGNPRDDRDWLTLTFESHGRSPFDGIFVADTTFARSGRHDSALVDVSHALGSAPRMACQSSRQVLRRPAEYRKLLTPLLRHAQEVTLIDPYLTMQEPRFLNTIGLCVELLGQRGYDPLVGRITIHAGDPERFVGYYKRAYSGQACLDACLEDWKRQIRTWFARGYRHEVHVLLWRDLMTPERLHDRYIFTDQCGIAVQGGLDSREDWSNSTSWSMLAEPVRKSIIEIYDPTYKRLELLRRLDVSP
ncbi:MAG: hypothetical protein ACR2PL_27110 [Dehalococcoidia bacterium]